jgi:hypothetical protein
MASAFNSILTKYRKISFTEKIKMKGLNGYHIVAYYYISWALAMPEMLSQLQLPFDEEYKLALTMHKPN